MSVIVWIQAAKVTCEVSGRTLIASGVLDLGTPICRRADDSEKVSARTLKSMTLTTFTFLLLIVILLVLGFGTVALVPEIKDA